MDTLTVRIPAAPSYVRIVRLIAAGLAARLGFTLEDIEDLKIAVDELTAYLTGSRGHAGTLEVNFLLYEDHIEIKGRAHLAEVAGEAESGEGSGPRLRTELTELSQKILETVVDSASLGADDGTPTFTLSKHRPARSPSRGGVL